MSSGASLPLVTVIVPAFNARAVLPHCLASLGAQTYPADCIQILVVDNGSRPDLSSVVAQFPGVTYLSEPTPGSYAARNRGLQDASGELLAFTDADCVPAPDWIEIGVARLQSTPNCGLVGGEIRLAFKTPHAPTVLECCDYVCNGGFPQRHFIEDDCFAATANAFMPRAALEQVGPFDASLMSGGDRNWGNRAAASGLSLVYAPDAVVEHPARATWGELARKARRMEGGRRDLIRHLKAKGQYARSKRSLKRRLAPPPVLLLRDDLQHLRDYPRLMGAPLRLSGGRLLGVIVVVALLRTVRCLEAARLFLGLRSFRG